MTTIDDVFEGMGESLVDTMGVSATYTPSVGDAVTLNVLLDKGVQMQPGPYEAQAHAQGVTISALLSELGKEPDRDETFTIGATTYTILTVLENDNLFVRCSVR